jgi:hypothetical protein
VIKSNIEFLIILKTNYSLVLISFFKKNIRVTVKAVAGILLICTVFLPIVKPSFYSYYLLHKNQVFIPTAVNNNSTNYYNQTIPARLSTFGIGKWVIPIYLITIVATLWIVYKSQNLLLGVLASIILSPVSWQHYFAVLFPVFVLAFIGSKKIYSLGILALSMFFWWVEFPFLHNARVNIFTAILSSHYLLSATTLFFVILKNKMNVLSASK